MIYYKKIDKVSAEKQEDILLKQYEILHNKITHTQNQKNKLANLCVIIYLTVIGYIGVTYVNYYKLIEYDINPSYTKVLTKYIDTFKTLEAIEQNLDNKETLQAFHNKNNEIFKNKIEKLENATKPYNIAIVGFAIFMILGFVCCYTSVFLTNKKLKHLYNKVETLEKSLNLESIDKYNKCAGYALPTVFAILTAGFIIASYVY